MRGWFGPLPRRKQAFVELIGIFVLLVQKVVVSDCEDQRHLLSHEVHNAEELVTLQSFFSLRPLLSSVLANCSPNLTELGVRE